MPEYSMNISVINGTDDITLSWIDTGGVDGYIVRRKIDGFPCDENDGYLVYGGTDKTIVDKALPGLKYFYSVFYYIGAAYALGGHVTGRIGDAYSMVKHDFERKLKNIIPNHYLE